MTAKIIIIWLNAVSKRMLIIEDEKEILELLFTIFSDQKEYEIICAENGLEALRIIESGRLDIVILDVNLPFLSGYDLCQKIRSNPETKRTKVLVLSGMAQRNDRLKAQEAGADGYLTKPFNSKELIETVKVLTGTEIKPS